MRKIDRLKASAKESAHFREHDMLKFETLSNTTAWSECRKCGMGTLVDAKPAPNGIDISGQAVAVNCPR